MPGRAPGGVREAGIVGPGRVFSWDGTSLGPQVVQGWARGSCVGPLCAGVGKWPRVCRVPLGAAGGLGPLLGMAGKPIGLSGSILPFLVGQMAFVSPSGCKCHNIHACFLFDSTRLEARDFKYAHAKAVGRSKERRKTRHVTCGGTPPAPPEDKTRKVFI